MAPSTRAVQSPHPAHSCPIPPPSSVRLLTAPSSDRRVLHLELDLSGSGMRYGPGDSVGLLPQNEAKLVEALLKRLGLPGEEVFDVAPAGGVEGGLCACGVGWYVGSVCVGWGGAVVCVLEGGLLALCCWRCGVLCMHAGSADCSAQ